MPGGGGQRLAGLGRPCHSACASPLSISSLAVAGCRTPSLGTHGEAILTWLWAWPSQLPIPSQCRKTDGRASPQAPWVAPEHLNPCTRTSHARTGNGDPPIQTILVDMPGATAPSTAIRHAAVEAGEELDCAGVRHSRHGLLPGPTRPSLAVMDSVRAWLPAGPPPPHRPVQRAAKRPSF